MHAFIRFFLMKHCRNKCAWAMQVQQYLACDALLSSTAQIPASRPVNVALDKV